MMVASELRVITLFKLEKPLDAVLSDDSIIISLVAFPVRADAPMRVHLKLPA